MVTAVATVCLVLAGCGGDDSTTGTASTVPATVGVSDAWTRQPAPGQTTAAVYAVVSNPTDADVTIVAASTPITDSAGLHETVMNDDGTMAMRPAEGGFVVPAGGQFTFEPGGAHIMLSGIDPSTYPTDHVEMTLRFDGADPVTFDADVRALDADTTDTTMGTIDQGSSGDAAAGADVVPVAVAVAGGSVSTDDDRVDVPLGDTVELTVTADVTDEVHVHGYDLHGDVAPGSPAKVTFTADIPGVFEVELEDAGLLLVELQVS